MIQCLTVQKLLFQTDSAALWYEWVFERPTQLKYVFESSQHVQYVLCLIWEGINSCQVWSYLWTMYSELGRAGERLQTRIAAQRPQPAIHFVPFHWLCDSQTGIWLRLHIKPVKYCVWKRWVLWVLDSIADLVSLLSNMNHQKQKQHTWSKKSASYVFDDNGVWHMHGAISCRFL